MFNPLSGLAHLRTRLAVIIAAALAPAGVLAISQGISALEDAEARRISQFEADALAAVDEARDAIVAVRQAIRQTAAAIEISLPVDDACDVALTALTETNAWAVSPAIYGRDGAFICGAGPEFALNERVVWTRFQTTRDYTLATMRGGTLAGDEVVFALRSIPNSGGLALGVGVDAQYLKRLIDPSTRIGDEGNAAAFALIGVAGEPLLRSGREDVSWLPEDRARLRTFSDRRVSAVAASGAMRDYFVSVIEPGQLWAVTVSAPRRLADVLTSNEAVAAVAPVVLWLIAVGVAYFTIDTLVTRHVSKLRRTAVRIGAGDLEAPVDGFDDAPQEFRALGDAIRAMRDNIAERETSMKETLDVQRRLILEVHHRVKNNLQTISSLLNLESRRATAESQTVMQTIQTRIHSLAMVHQNLYAAERLEEVALDQLARDIASHLETSLAPRASRSGIDFDLAPIAASTTHATPIALFLSEAIGNAFKHGRAPFDVGVVLRRIDDRFELTVSNLAGGPETSNGGDGDGGDEMGGLGLKLMAGFAKQISATFTSTREGDRFVARLTGPLLEEGALFAVRRPAET